MKQRRFECVVVTGLSGAGKSVALNALEDLGFFCVDNLPLPLLSSLVRLYMKWGHRLSRVAVGVDVRTGIPAKEFHRSLANLRKEGIDPRIVFMDSETNTLVRRFSETRRRHPLGGPILSGIRRERKRLQTVKESADRILDTSRLVPTELKEILVETLGLRHPHGMAVAVVSFGYKFGVPVDADVVWDVRFLPNPYYVPRLRPLTGRRVAVARHVLGNPVARRFMGHLRQTMAFLTESFAKEGKSYLTVGVGCTGGRHRSVAITESLADFLRKKRGLDVRVRHRDMSR